VLIAEVCKLPVLYLLARGALRDDFLRHVAL